MNNDLLAWVSVALVLCNLYLLSTSKITRLIRGVAVQGFLIGVLPILMPSPVAALHVVILVVLSVTVKGFFIPFYLLRAIRDVRQLREIHPLVGPSLSMFYGTVVSSAAFFALHIAPILPTVFSPFHAATASATAFIGLFLIVTSRNVLRQIIGYIVLENSTFIFGISLAAFQPLFVEMGVLIDMLVAVFIMLAAVSCIHNEHDSVSVRPLERLTR